MNWKQLVGIQTICWGEIFPIYKSSFGRHNVGSDQLKRVLQSIGISGVEFAQVPDGIAAPEALDRWLGRAEDGAPDKLNLLGFAGGSLSSRVAYVGRLKSRPKYLYVQELCDEDGKPLADVIHSLETLPDVSLGIHPHFYTRISTLRAAINEILNFRKHRPDLAGRVGILPDTAHAYLAGEDVMEFILEAVRLEVPILALHLKDWTPKFGRSSFTFSRGFVELGSGEVVCLRVIRDILHGKHTSHPRAQEIARALMGVSIVIEQDSSISPLLSINESIQWLFKVPSKLRRSNNLINSNADQSKLSVWREPELISFLSRTANMAAYGIHALHSEIAKQTLSLLRCSLVTIWEIHPEHDKALFRTAAWPHFTDKKLPFRRVISLRESLAGISIEDRKMLRFCDLKAVINKRCFQDSAWAEELNLNQVICLPISNRWNINQPEILINCFYEERNLTQAEEENIKLVEKWFPALREHTSYCLEVAWDHERLRISYEASWIGSCSGSSNQLLDQAVGLIQQSLPAAKIGIYFADQITGELCLKHFSDSHADALVPIALTQHAVLDDSAFREVAISAFVQKSPINQVIERLDSKPTNKNLLAVPMFLDHRPISAASGVIVCEAKANYRQSGSLFVDDEQGSFGLRFGFGVTDQALLDAIQSALMPHLSRLVALETRWKTLHLLQHEMNLPADLIPQTCRQITSIAERLGAVNLIDEAVFLKRCTNLLHNLAHSTIYTNPEHASGVKKTRVLLFQDVILPALEYAELIAEDTKFEESLINSVSGEKGSEEPVLEAHHFQVCPPLYVDKLAFQQLFFNLIANAIKYRGNNPLNIEIFAKTAQDGWEIFVRDRGMGVSEKFKSSIFEEGFRDPLVARLGIPGHGIGLWLSKRIVSAHGGHMEVRQNKEPTEFVIYLPSSLEKFSI